MWASRSFARSPNAHASDPVLVHRLACLLRASFRPRLAAQPLRFTNPSPPSGWVEDFHLQTIERARHTKEGRRPWSPPESLAIVPRETSPGKILSPAKCEGSGRTAVPESIR